MCRKLILFCLIINSISCSNKEKPADMLFLIKQHTGIEINNYEKIDIDYKTYDIQDYSKSVILKLNKGDLENVITQIEKTPLFNNTNIDSLSLINYKTTGYWIKINKKYLFREPYLKNKLGINSLFFSNDSYTIEAQLNISKLEFKFTYNDI